VLAGSDTGVSEVNRSVDAGEEVGEEVGEKGGEEVWAWDTGMKHALSAVARNAAGNVRDAMIVRMVHSSYVMFAPHTARMER
jgi:hypothetical protein